MDPVSIIGLASTCIGLAAKIYEVKSTLELLYEKLRTSELAISALIIQLASLEASITELGSILQEEASSISRKSSLITALQQSIASCEKAIQYLYDQVADAKAESESGTGLRRWTRTKWVFNADSLAPMKEILRDQVQAIQLLLSIAALRNQAEQEVALENDDTKESLRRASDGSSTLLGPQDADSASSILTYETDNLSRLSMMFKFDLELLDSKPYRAALMATWRQVNRRKKNPQEPSPKVTRRQETISILVPGNNDKKMSHSIGGSSKVMPMIVKHDFHAERSDELESKQGEVLVPVALSDTDDDWILVKPVQRLGGPGLIPLSFVTFILPSGKSSEDKIEILSALREMGVPGVMEWKEFAIQARLTMLAVGTES